MTVLDAYVHRRGPTAAAGPRAGDRAGDRSGRAARTLRRWTPRFLGLTAAGLVPWMVYLARTLPATTEVRHWPAAWVGLDVVLALGCASTAVLLHRRDPRARITAAATATAAVLDVWFDVTTAAAGAELAQALACGGVELVFATGLTAIAAGALEHRGSRSSER